MSGWVWPLSNHFEKYFVTFILSDLQVRYRVIIAYNENENHKNGYYAAQPTLLCGLAIGSVA